jgi:Uma2 family endonuclease
MGGDRMIKAKKRIRQRLILYSVSWPEYTRILRSFEHRHLRITYDRGTLEIMTLSHLHENSGRFLGRLVFTLTEELELPMKGGGSTTFRRKKKQKGLEPDDCYWIAHEAAVRGKKAIDLRIDPPPDLAMEVDITRSSMNRMGIYAALYVPEVWRYDRNGLAFLVLNAAGKYDSAPISPTFSLPITPADLLPFMDMRNQMDENAVIREFRLWIRAKLAAPQP